MAAPATLPPEEAATLFYNGHKIAKVGDPPSKWIGMGRLPDGTAIIGTPMTAEIEQAIRSGQYYLAEGVTDWEDEPTPAEPPKNVDIPYVGVTGSQASCTMGNWQGEPTGYAYAWQRDGEPIEGAASADYLMGEDDTGKQIGCIVTATNAAGSTAAPPSNTVTGP